MPRYPLPIIRIRPSTAGTIANALAAQSVAEQKLSERAAEEHRFADAFIHRERARRLLFLADSIRTLTEPDSPLDLEL